MTCGYCEDCGNYFEGLGYYCPTCKEVREYDDLYIVPYDTFWNPKPSYKIKQYTKDFNNQVDKNNKARSMRTNPPTPKSWLDHNLFKFKTFADYWEHLRQEAIKKNV